jgi:lysine-specific demethylase 8
MANAAWFLFDSDDDEATVKKTSACVSGGDPPASAATHAYFAPCRAALWSSEAVTATSESFVAALVADARARVPAVAAGLRVGARDFAEAHVAADAILAAAYCAADADWPAVAQRAEDARAAHTRRLERGNWPHAWWQRSHVFALGFHVAAAVSTSAVDETSSDLGAVMLEALSMATLADSADEIPGWLGACLRVAERRCLAIEAQGDKDEDEDDEDINTLDENKHPPLTAATIRECSSSSSWMIPSRPPFDAPSIRDDRSIARVDALTLSVADFYARFVATETPVILEKCATPAMGWAPTETWRDMRRLLSLEHGTAGTRIVPVATGGFGEPGELGVTSLGRLVRKSLRRSNQGMFQTSSRLKQKGFKEHISTPSVAYMSQHALFHQIPELQSFIAVPKFALGRLCPDTGAVNAWLGTEGTRTALHRDAYCNLLCQTAGFKYVRTYAADQTRFLYPEETTHRGGEDNTFSRSAVLVEAPDTEKFPKFAEARFEEALLAPGDALFLPRGMWHYVRGLTTSFSVNFWWN